MPEVYFPYRILVVEDEPIVHQMLHDLLQAKGYEVLCVEDGFEGLVALKGSLPDMILSDLRMPNMNGFEFLSVVRRRFPVIPVIVVSGEFTGCNVPEGVLADAYFSKGGFQPAQLFAKIEQFLIEPPRTGNPPNAAIWVKNSGDMVVVTCPDCLRTFPVTKAPRGVNEVHCDFCPALIRFEIKDDRRNVEYRRKLKDRRKVECGRRAELFRPK